MKQRKNFLLIIFTLIIVFLIVCIIYSFNLDSAVKVNIDAVYVDNDYLNDRTIPYNTEGKKIVSCDINFKSYSFYKFEILEIKNDQITPIYANNFPQEMSDMSIFSTQIIPCAFLVDENMEMGDVKEKLALSEIVVMNYIADDGIDADFSYLSVDKITE